MVEERKSTKGKYELAYGGSRGDCTVGLGRKACLVKWMDDIDHNQIFIVDLICKISSTII